VLGELAFAKRYDARIDTDTYEKSDGRGDFHMNYDGERCYFDVKTPQKEPYGLFVKEGCTSADYYVLGHLSEEARPLKIIFYGMAAREDVLKADLSETPHDHRNHVVPVEALDPIPEPEALKPVG